MLVYLKDQRAIALLLAASLTILSNTLISPALPGIEARFAGQPYAELMTRMLVTAPALLVALAAPFAGMLVDRFGRRRQLLVGVVLFAIAGSAGLWLPSLTLILASRLVLGLAVALIMTAQSALIGDYFSPAARSGFMGAQVAATNFSGLVFLLLSGALAGYSPFAPFAIYAIALLYLPLFWVALPEPVRESAHQPDPALAGKGAPRWHATLGTIVVFAVISMTCFYLLPTQAPYFLARLGHPEPAMTGYFLAALTLSCGLASLGFGAALKRLGNAKTASLGFAVFAAGFCVLAVATSLPMVFAGALVIGSGIGFIMPIFLTIALSVAPAQRRGMAAGTVTTSVFLGQFLSPLFSQPVIDATGFAGVFGISAATLGVLCIASLFAFRDKHRSVR